METFQKDTDRDHWVESINTVVGAPIDVALKLVPASHILSTFEMNKTTSSAKKKSLVELEPKLFEMLNIELKMNVGKNVREDIIRSIVECNWGVSCAQVAKILTLLPLVDERLSIIGIIIPRFVVDPQNWQIISEKCLFTYEKLRVAELFMKDSNHNASKNNFDGNGNNPVSNNEQNQTNQLNQVQQIQTISPQDQQIQTIPSQDQQIQTIPQHQQIQQ